MPPPFWKPGSATVVAYFQLGGTHSILETPLTLCFTKHVKHCISYLHHVADGFSLGENLTEGLGTEDVPQGGLGQQARRVGRVLHIHH